MGVLKHFEYRNFKDHQDITFTNQLYVCTLVYLINMQHVLINFMEYSNLHGLITSCMFINFGKFPSQVDFFTIDFWKIPTCMVLLHPARLLIFGNFPANLIFLLLIFEKFQPAWPYYVLHVYKFWEIFQSNWISCIDFWKIPTWMALLHPSHLLILGKFPACMIITSCTFIR